MTKLVSTTLSGNAEDVIAEALLSASGFVDQCLVIDTGITDGTLKAARAAVGDKLVVRSYPWVNDFAAARNAALRFAETLGADLAVTLDTDERLLFAPGWRREEFTETEDVDLWYVQHMDRSYMKERIIRLGRGVYWEGPTHEWTGNTPSERKAYTVSLTFTEIAKTPAQIVHKNQRDLDILLDYAPAHPEQPRWWMYLGLTLQNMKRYDQAIPHLQRAARMHDYREFDGKLAVFRAAQCYILAQRFEEGLAWMGEALAGNPSEPQFLYYQKMLAHKAAVFAQHGHA